MSLAIVMVHYGNIATTKSALLSLTKKNLLLPLYLLNNTQSDLSTLRRTYPKLTLINSATNLGYAKAANIGLMRAYAEGASYVLLLNNDLCLTSGSLTLLTSLLPRAESSLIAPLLHHSGGFDWGAKLSRYTGFIKHTNFPNAPKTEIKVAHFAFAAVIISHHLYEILGPLPESYFCYFEDVEYSLRARQHNIALYITPRLVFDHTVSGSSTTLARTLTSLRSHLTFVTRHLFRGVWPTAYLAILTTYPLYLVKAIIRGK